MESDILDCQSHNCCSEEHPDSVFDGEWELLVGGVLMVFHMGKVVKDEPEDKLVEQDNQE